MDTYAILGMKKSSVTAALRKRGQDTTGDLRMLRARLIDTMHRGAALSVAPSAVPAAGAAGSPAAGTRDAASGESDSKAAGAKCRY